ncbi:MAG TPA: 50S ribosomal protein L23 [Firmicutes bacterium]|jgi:large subunit ribosomal protein L23|nr:50S ribosomal protein L23 [Bacillota bacterium]
MQSPWDIIRRPLVTEKAMRLVGENKYSFEVDRKANKTEIKQAIEAVFKVKVKKVQTLQVPAKPKRLGRYVGRTSAWKKAIVTLEEGQTLPFFEGA